MGIFFEKKYSKIWIYENYFIILRREIKDIYSIEYIIFIKTPNLKEIKDNTS